MGVAVPIGATALSLANMAEMYDVNRRTLIRHTNELVRLGILSKTHHRGFSVTRMLEVPPVPEEVSPPLSPRTAKVSPPLSPPLSPNIRRLEGKNEKKKEWETEAALCANIAETTASSLITVEGEEKTDVKRYEKQRSPRS